MTTPFHPPVKRSVEIAGHKTSISLEPLFWELL
ncbi:MAG TPA: ribbon-helix-helix domain-containing protein, partial [Novosphingobium sp.]|nr:ribbon-helix-helix domain-containing protein [Novosphingobium sp.]